MHRNATLAGVFLLALGGCKVLGDAKEDSAAVVEARATPPATAVASDDTETVSPRLLRRFRAISAQPSRDAKAELGKQLFRDARLSSDGRVSCNSCHDLEKYGVDGVAFSTGVDGHVGGRNAPTVLNASASFVQFWDGRAATLEEQAKGPLLNPAEMGASEASVRAVLDRAPEYDAAFRLAFPGELETKDVAHVSAAIAAFERTLVTPSRWDAFLSGDAEALSRSEKKGLKVFINSGCMVCHTGVNLGGASFERLGVIEPWPNDVDRGRMQITGAAADSMMFKVPTLRNVAKTAPYFHDGSAATLDEAVKMMGRHQLGIELGDEDRGAIVAWLGALTGELAPAVR